MVGLCAVWLENSILAPDIALKCPALLFCARAHSVNTSTSAGALQHDRFAMSNLAAEIFSPLSLSPSDKCIKCISFSCSNL